MAYDEGLATRLHEILLHDDRITSRKMFGGLAFMCNGHMFVGINGDELMVRVGKPNYEAALAHEHAREMDFTGRSLKGYIYVSTDGFEEDEDLRRWVDLAQDFVLTLPAKKKR